MKTDLTKIDITDFNMQPCTFAGDECVWVFPKLEGVKWTKDNLIYRSSIWRKSDGELISASFKKFFNWAQEPDIYPPPNALTKKINVLEKLDGSCLVISKYKSEYIIRTRRALARTMLNGEEIDEFLKKYPKLFDNHLIGPGLNTASVSIICEWLTPSNQIVVRYPEPELRLIGVVHHPEYHYEEQWIVDNYAWEWGIKRPKKFTYKTIEEMLQNIADLNGEEGVCVYYGNDQHIRKVKSDWYLSVHNFRNAMNIKNIIDLFFIMDMPKYDKFCEGVQNQFQYEGLVMAKPLISIVCDGMKEVDRIVAGMKHFVDSMKASTIAFPTRKEMAAHTLSSYGTTNRADMIFTLLDGKELMHKQYKKLLFQVIAK